MRASHPAALLDFVALNDRVRECFFRVQKSWSSRDVSASRAFVSDALYERHRVELEAMKRRNRANRIKELVLRDIRVIQLDQGSDGKWARFAARIEASARDWVADLGRGVVVGGDPDEQRSFVEYWTFSRDPENGWVLDEIRHREWHLPRRPR
jgi:predicted lipid-binding transport protein (Tim44 family)